MGNIEILVDNGSRGNIGPRNQFIGTATQKLEHRLVQTAHLPLLAKLCVNQLVNFFTAGINARYNVVEKVGIGVRILRVFDFLPQDDLATVKA